MKRQIIYTVGALLILSAALNAATVRFGSDPFAGSDALTTPGRQVVGGEPSISFDTTTDLFSFDPAFFNVGGLLFANGLIADIPEVDVNVVVLQTLDNDANPATPFGAGNAANLIADRITTPGAGFFIYFNSGLNLPRLVYSTDLSDNTADLKILARMTNLLGQPDALPAFGDSNFALEPVPEPSSIFLMSAAGALLACRFLRNRRRA